MFEETIAAAAVLCFGEVERIVEASRAFVRSWHFEMDGVDWCSKNLREEQRAGPWRQCDGESMLIVGNDVDDAGARLRRT